ncbi:MAG: FkbM family methyltransferase, partial [Cyanobacteriota bacterium]
DVFKGGLESLREVLAIVSEVEFLPLYLGQPLFGEVCSYLAGQGLAFHHFLGLAGRTLRPIIINKDANDATQHFWADALFVRDAQAANALTAQQLLKLSVLSVLYGTPDLAYDCLALYDQRHQTETA